MPRARLSRRALLAGAVASPAVRAQGVSPPVIGVLTDRSGFGASVSGPPLVLAVF